MCPRLEPLGGAFLHTNAAWVQPAPGRRARPPAWILARRGATSRVPAGTCTAALAAGEGGSMSRARRLCGTWAHAAPSAGRILAARATTPAAVPTTARHQVEPRLPAGAQALNACTRSEGGAPWGCAGAMAPSASQQTWQCACHRESLSVRAPAQRGAAQRGGNPSSPAGASSLPQPLVTSTAVLPEAARWRRERPRERSSAGEGSARPRLAASLAGLPTSSSAAVCMESTMTSPMPFTCAGDSPVPAVEPPLVAEASASSLLHKP